MNKSHAILPVLMVGLMAAAGAHAQSTSAAGSSDGPPKAGEASTQTQGAPNAKTTNSPFSEAPTPSKDVLRQEAQGMGSASATSPVAPKAGEASTFVQGKPNATNPMPTLSRAQVIDELMTRRARFEAHRRALVNGTARYDIASGIVIVQ